MMSPILFILVSLLLSASLPACRADPFAFANYFSNNMVLQRTPQQAVVWGWGDVGQTITISLDGEQVAEATVVSPNVWTAQLPAQLASFGHTLTGSDGTDSYDLHGVAFGDVYLCSGQSNMQVTLNYSWGAAEAMAAAPHYPNLRLFNVPQQQSNWTVEEPQVSWAPPNSWRLPANDTLQNPNNRADRSSFFSATCYWTGMHLYDALNGTVPIGLVQASVGGTQVASWTSNATNLVCGPLVTPFGSDQAPRNWPSVEYNAMIHPLLRMRLTAVLWYQGETDWWDADRYACSFPNLINDWRTNFQYGKALPFYFVLVHPYGGANPVSRQSQQRALALPNVGVANAIDLGDRYGIAGDIHPRNKTYVGMRLARWLRRDIYGQDVEVEGPQLLDVLARIVDSALEVRLRFAADSRSEGLFALATPDCSNNYTDARHCCSQAPANTYDHLITYSWRTSGGGLQVGSSPAVIDATARTVTVTDSSANIPAGGGYVTVEYANIDWPGCALYGVARLPALPFVLNVSVMGAGPAPPAPPALRLNNALSSNMVLQRAPQQAVVWGWGVPGSSVTAQVNGTAVGSATVTEAGTWKVQLPPYQTALNTVISVSDGTTTLTLSNVAFGDVYLCSGQSNMQVAVNYSFSGSEAIRSASKYTNIRLLNVNQQNASVPYDEAPLSYRPDSWQLPSDTSLQPAWDPSNPYGYFSAVCYWTGVHLSDALHGTVPIGLIHSSYGGSPLRAWPSPDTVNNCGPFDAVVPVEANVPAGMLGDSWDPSAEYNAMIHPLLPTRLAGVLWYQGESDAGATERYKCSFPGLINDWRTKFATPELPFYFVQLAPYRGANPWMREAQLSGLSLPLTGVASAIDLGDRYGRLGDLHPRNKSYIGERLARWIRRDVYKEQVEVEGPHLLSITARNVNAALTLTLRYSDDGRSQGLFALPTPDCNANATGPSRCCSAQQQAGELSGLVTYWWPAGNGTTVYGSAAASIDASARTITVVDTSAGVPQTGGQVWVSYAWDQWPGCALYNEARLPALPFYRNVTVGQAAAELRLNNLFSSDMVLQRAPQRAAMWGSGEPGATVTVQLARNNSVATTTVSDGGMWKVHLPAMQASVDQTIMVSDGITTLTLSNVAFGDVYLCSGQSNMQVALSYSFGGADAIASAASKYPQLRLFNLEARSSNYTLDQAAISYPSGWVRANASTLTDGNSFGLFSATCFYAGSAVYDAVKRADGDLPIGLVQASYGGSAVHAWTSPDTNTACGPIVTPSGGDNTAYNRPSVLYNAMIYPLLPLRLTAVLWYQGETDWWDADRYACSFPNLINDWRMKFNASLPFYFVELAPTTSAANAVRLSQQQALLLPMTGVANAIDLGDRTAPAGNVHPRNKSYVGERLALAVRVGVYAQDVEWRGPQLVSAMAYTSSSSFGLTLQFASDRSSQGLFALPTPDCDANATDASRCCRQSESGAYEGLLYYSWTDSSGVSHTAAPSVRVDSTNHALTMTAPLNLSPSAGQTVLLSHANVNWPGCALYNSARLPALPFVLNVTVAQPATLRFANIFSSNMVLQRMSDKGVVWGVGQPGASVTLRVDNDTAPAVTVSDVGEWSVNLPRKEAGLGHTMTVTDGTTSVTLSNVAFGDVYLCSGQSNMQVDLNYTFGGAEAIAAAARYPNLRLFSKPPQNATMEQRETAVAYSPDSWVLPSASTLYQGYSFGYFSAVCYWTGMHLYDSLNGSVPIGLVQSSFGGTVAAAWTSAQNVNSKCGPLVPIPAGVYENAPFNAPSVLYNAMIVPLLRLQFSAVLWYQGQPEQTQHRRHCCPLCCPTHVVPLSLPLPCSVASCQVRATSTMWSAMPARSLT